MARRGKTLGKKCRFWGCGPPCGPRGSPLGAKVFCQIFRLGRRDLVRGLFFGKMVRGGVGLALGDRRGDTPPFHSTGGLPWQLDLPSWSAASKKVPDMNGTPRQIWRSKKEIIVGTLRNPLKATWMALSPEVSSESFPPFYGGVRLILRF